MNYKRKKGFGGLGGGGRGGSYRPTRDPMVPYRRLSQREDEYHRKVKHAVERDEVSAGSFRDAHPSYKVMPLKIREVDLEKTSVDEMRDSVLREVMNKLRDEKKEVTQELYEKAQEQSELVSDKLAKSQEKSAVDFTDELLTENDTIRESNEGPGFLSMMNDARQVIVDDKRKEIEEAKDLEEVEKKFSEIRETNDVFFSHMDSDLNQDDMKRRRFDSQDEVGY